MTFESEEALHLAKTSEQAQSCGHHQRFCGSLALAFDVLHEVHGTVIASHALTVSGSIHDSQAIFLGQLNGWILVREGRWLFCQAHAVAV